MLETIFALDKIHPIDLIPTFLPAHAFPPEYKGKEDEYVDLICDEMLPIAEVRITSNSKLSDYQFFVDVFCEKNAFNLEQSRRVLETAKKLGFGLKAHVDEFTNLGAARMAIELGATSIDHLDATSDEEIELVGKIKHDRNRYADREF